MANFISTYTPKQASTDKGVAYLWRLSSESGTARGDHKKRLRLTRVLVHERLYAERRAVIGADRPPPVLIRVLHVGRALWCAPRRTASPTPLAAITITITIWDPSHVQVFTTTSELKSGGIDVQLPLT
jgi:hypothetical protein